MRIIAGSLKGRIFRVPSNLSARPTTDYAKEGLFNILGNQRGFDELEILDLCSGTGNLAFEFISRGCTSVLAVDKDPKACRWLSKNAHDLSITNQLRVQQMDALKFLERTNQQFDLIFSDPPFASTMHKAILEITFQRNILREQGLLILEHGSKSNFEQVTNFTQARNFGNVTFSFFEIP